MKSQSSVFDQSDLPHTQRGATSAPGKWEPKLPKDERNALINIYNLHPTAEVAVEELQKAKFDVIKFAIVCREYLDGYWAGGERMKFWTWRGIFWGGLAGLLVSVGLPWMPGVSPLLNMILCVVQGAVVGGGLSALEKCVLIMRGTEEEAAEARDIISANTGATEFVTKTGKETSR